MIPATFVVLGRGRTAKLALEDARYMTGVLDPDGEWREVSVAYEAVYVEETVKHGWAVLARLSLTAKARGRRTAPKSETASGRVSTRPRPSA